MTTVNQELARLKRLKVSTMNTTVARKQIQTTIANLDKVAKTAQQQQAVQQQQLRAVTTQFEKERTKTAQQASQIAKLTRDLKLAQAQRDEAVEAAGKGMNQTIFGQRIEKFQAQLAEKEALLRANDKVRENLQAQLDKVNTSAKTVSTDNIFKGFAADIAKAQKEIPDEFEIADVQVELRGALGQEGNKMVMGLDARRQVETGQETKVAFTLRRAATIKAVE